jgi:hypothetical protein
MIHGGKKRSTRFSCVHLIERDHLEEKGVDGRKILKWMLIG